MCFDTQTVKILLDAAREISGSDYKTAQRIKTQPMTVNHWRKGKAKMPAADVVLVALIAGLDAIEWGSRAIAEKHKGTEKGDALNEALFFCAKSVWPLAHAASGIKRMVCAKHPNTVFQCGGSGRLTILIDSSAFKSEGVTDATCCISGAMAEVIDTFPARGFEGLGTSERKAKSGCDC